MRLPAVYRCKEHGRATTRIEAAGGRALLGRVRRFFHKGRRTKSRRRPGEPCPSACLGMSAHLQTFLLSPIEDGGADRPPWLVHRNLLSSRSSITGLGLEVGLCQSQRLRKESPERGRRKLARIDTSVSLGVPGQYPWTSEAVSPLSLCSYVQGLPQTSSGRPTLVTAYIDTCMFIRIYPDTCCTCIRVYIGICISRAICILKRVVESARMCLSRQI